MSVPNAVNAPQPNRRVTVITGASGGMGKTCARRLGKRYPLVLADVDVGSLESEAAALRSEGYDVALASAVDVSKRDNVQNLALHVSELGSLAALVHTAGVSTASADWSTIIEVNLRGTSHVLDAFLPIASQGSVAVCVASIQGHTAPADPELDRLIDAPSAPQLLRSLEPFVEQYAQRADVRGLASVAYSISKRAIIRMCEQRVCDWASAGARIVSISPGLIDTPMGRKEFAENPRAALVFQKAPLQRWGTPEDIACAIEFLCSDEASFITGTDLRIDGGIIPVLATLQMPVSQR